MVNINKISKIGLGTGTLASLGVSISQAECNHLIKTGFEHGVTVLDTADTYGSGDAELMIGKAIKGNRDNLFLITKAGFPYISLPHWASPINQIGKKVLQKSGASKNFSKSYLINALQKSLKRLGVEAVDAFVLHEPVYSEINDECWEALELIRTQGMAIATGVSTFDYKVIAEGIEHKQIQIVETPVGLLQTSDRAIATICKKNQIPIIANQILFNYNKIGADKSIELDVLLAKYNFKKNDLIKVFIKYPVSSDGVECTLIGTKKIDHLIENSKIIADSDKLNYLYEDIKKLML